MSAFCQGFKWGRECRTDGKVDPVLFFAAVRIFVHRYRDIDPAIRAMSSEALGTWINSYPQYFLKDKSSRLKYLGWSVLPRFVARCMMQAAAE
jgi:hypothetical protein